MDGYITFAAATADQAQELTALVPRLRAHFERLAQAGNLRGRGPVLMGIGASYAAAAAAVWHLRKRGIEAARLDPGESPMPIVVGESPVFAISQSGRSTETLAALESVVPERRFGIVNVTPSPLSALATDTIDLGSIDDSYASTIGYTATVSALGMLAEAWDGGDIAADWDTLGARFAAAERDLAPAITAAAALFENAPSADFVGSATSVGSAEAGALLFREVARIPSTAMSTRQYLHGAMESAGAGVHVLFGTARERKAARMLAGAGHPVILISDDGSDPLPLVTTIVIPTLSDTQRGVIEALVMQQLVREVAENRGIAIEEFVFENDDTKAPSQVGA
ncbi:SIS domain-containing protein [Mycetocola saprophilus]|uniref:SIS domain-containing protein n=1 Tax=Mycetocola saprophilus TaxID=76636 RepID=UPI0004BF4D50|nr:SIS domain-containing protein [Mycetocola saprophilus]